MKKRNAVVGMKVQVKRDCYGHSDELIEEGLVCNVSRIDSISDDYELRLEHPDIDGGWAWVNASDVRRYKEEVPEEPQKFLTKGTRVQVKSTLIGKWGEKLREGDIYILQGDEDTSCDGADRRIDVKSVAGSSVWSTQPKYFDVLPEPAFKDLSSLRVGDYIVANDTNPHLQEGVAYRVVKVGATFPLVALHHSENAYWRKEYCVIPRNVAKILREVNDATPRVVKLGSESTCRSE